MKDKISYVKTLQTIIFYIHEDIIKKQKFKTQDAGHLGGRIKGSGGNEPCKGHARMAGKFPFLTWWLQEIVSSSTKLF